MRGKGETYSAGGQLGKVLRGGGDGGEGEGDDGEGAGEHSDD
jgi:hypothetical protein